MTSIRITQRELEALAPSVLALWLVGLAAGASSVTPVLRQVPDLSDRDAFTPGALLLAEAVRLHRSALESSLGRALVIFALAQVALLLIRGRLFAKIAATSRNQRTRRSFLSGQPRFLGISVLQLLSYAMIAVATLVTWRETPPLFGALPPRAVFMKLLTLASAGAVFVTTATAFDLWRLSVFHEHENRIDWSLRTLRDSGRRLVVLRVGRLLVSGTLGILVLRVSANPWLASKGALTLVVGQGAALLALLCEAGWLLCAERALLGTASCFEQRAVRPALPRPDRSADGAEPLGPTPNPDA